MFSEKTKNWWQAVLVREEEGVLYEYYIISVCANLTTEKLLV